jgi:hypothetical protein
LNDREVAQAGLQIRLQLLIGIHQLDAEAVLVEELAGYSRSVFRNHPDKSILRQDFIVGRDERADEAIRSSPAADIREIRSKTRTCVADAVTVETFVGLDEPASTHDVTRWCLVDRRVLLR